MTQPYQQTVNPITGALAGGVLRRADNAYIPDDPSNADWGDYQAWLAEGNVPDPPEPLPQASAAAPSPTDVLTERIEALEARMAALERRT